MSITSRLNELERRFEPGGCPECGHGADIDPAAVTFAIDTAGEEGRSQPCPACGRPAPSFTLNIGTAGRSAS